MMGGLFRSPFHHDKSPMKKTRFPQSAPVRFRLLLAVSLCLAGLCLAVTASISREDLSIARWIGLQNQALVQAKSFLKDHNWGGGAVKLDKYPAERPPGTSQTESAITDTTAPQLLAPVTAVHTGKLRDMPPINPATVVNH